MRPTSYQAAPPCIGCRSLTRPAWGAPRSSAPAVPLNRQRREVLLLGALRALGAGVALRSLNALNALNTLRALRAFWSHRPLRTGFALRPLDTPDICPIGFNPCPKVASNQVSITGIASSGKINRVSQCSKDC